MQSFFLGTKGVCLSIVLCNSLRFGRGSAPDSSTKAVRRTSSTSVLPPAKCSLGFLRCPVPEGTDYSVLGSEGVGAPCRAKHGNAPNFVSFAIGQCNATVVHETDRETYHVTLIPVPHGPIVFLDEGPVIKCTCAVITSADSILNVNGSVAPVEAEGVSGSSDFEAILHVFGSSSFSTPLVPGKAAPATKSFYLELASSRVGDNIGVDTCVTSPFSDFPDDFTMTLMNKSSCDAGYLGIHRLESPSKNIVHIQTRAFMFYAQRSVHIRCTLLRCAAGSSTCAPCGADRRLSVPSSGDTVGWAVASFGAPASTGDGSILVFAKTEEAFAADTQGDGGNHEASAGHSLALAFPTFLLLSVGIAVLVVVA